MSFDATITGRVVTDPEIAWTTGPHAKARTKFRFVTAKPVRNDAGEWSETETTFWDVTAWGPLAERLADGAAKGLSLVLRGHAYLRTFTRADGSQGAALNFTALDGGPNLRVAPPGEGRPAAAGARQGAPGRAPGGQAPTTEPEVDPWAL